MSLLNSIIGTCVPHIIESLSAPLADKVRSFIVVPDALTSNAPLTLPLVPHIVERLNLESPAEPPDVEACRRCP